MTNEKERSEQTEKLLKWINEYSWCWRLISTPGDERMDISMMKSLIEKLEKESFYEIIFVLLMVHRNESYMSGLNQRIINELLIKDWNKDNRKYYINILKDYFE